MSAQPHNKDQLNALQLILNWPQLIATLIVVPIVSLRLNPENFAVSPAQSWMPIPLLLAPLLATALLWGLQALFVYWYPMQRKATIERGTWNDRYKGEEKFWQRWALGALNFAGSAAVTWFLLQFAQVIAGFIIAVLFFVLQPYLLAAVFIPLTLYWFNRPGPHPIDQLKSLLNKVKAIASNLLKKLREKINAKPKQPRA